VGGRGQTRTRRRAPWDAPETLAAPGIAGRCDHLIRWLGTAWALIGIGDAMTRGAFSWPALLFVVAGSVILVMAVLMRSLPSMHPSAFSTVIVITALFVPFYLLAPGALRVLAVTNVLSTFVALVIMVSGVVMTVEQRHNRWRFMAIAGLASAAALSTIVVSPSPHNDVWFMYEAASHALLHGHNFYLTHWTSGLAGDVSNQFTYLPMSVVLLAPFHLLFGDVRYGLVAATLLASWCAYKLAGPRSGWLCAAFILLIPKSTFGIAMSWNDPLLLAGIGGMVLAVRRRRLGWAMVALIVVLSSKQYAWLFLPLAAMWEDFGWRRALASGAAAIAVCLPWALTAPRAFWQGVVLYNLDMPARFDSLSLYSAAVHRGVVPGYVLIVGLTLVGLAAALLLLPRTAYGFLAGCAVVMATYNLANKQSFFNQWELVAGLIVLSMAAALGAMDEASLPGRALGRAHHQEMTAATVGGSP
jgi:hypothetical protein